jgi:hypothetical protein
VSPTNHPRTETDSVPETLYLCFQNTGKWTKSKTPVILIGLCHRLRVFEERMLRRIFRQKRDDIIKGWRK